MGEGKIKIENKCVEIDVEGPFKTKQQHINTKQRSTSF